MVQGRAKAVDVRPGVGLAHAAELLRGSIADGAQTGGVRQVLLLVFPGGAEVDEGHVAVGLQHDVGGLHVAVDDGRVLAVQIAQHVTELLRPFDDVLLGLRAELLQGLAQRVALDVVHDDDEGFVRVDDIDDAGEVGVIELFENVGLGHQALLHRLKVQDAVLANFLDGPLLVGLLVHGEIDHAHAALADLVQNFILAVYQRSDFEHIDPP